MWHQVMQGPTALLARIATSGKSVITHAEPIPQEELSTCMTACADSCLLSTGFRVTGDDQKRQLCAASTFTCDIRDASTQQEPEAIGVVHRTLASLRDVSGMCIIMRESITTTQPVAEDQMKLHSLSSALCVFVPLPAQDHPLQVRICVHCWRVHVVFSEHAKLVRASFQSLNWHLDHPTIWVPWPS